MQILDLVYKVTTTELTLGELWVELAGSTGFAEFAASQLDTQWTNLVGLSALVFCTFACQPCRGAGGHLSAV